MNSKTLPKIPLSVEMWPIDRVKPYPRNPRLNKDAVEAVAASIQEFGFRQPIVVDANGVIIAGHTRRLAAMELKLATVPVVVAKDLTPVQVRAYRIADNATAERSEWEDDLLAAELAGLKSDFDLALLGFEADALAQHTGNIPAKGHWPEIKDPVSHTVIIRYVKEDSRLLKKFCGDMKMSLTDGHAGKKILERIRKTTSG